jgi:hypothetical protein
MSIRAIIGWGFIASLILAVATASFFARQSAARGEVIADFKACVAAVEGRSEAKPIAQVCKPPIAAAALAAAKAKACDEALPADPFGAQAACTTPVKTVVAERDAARGDIIGLKAELKLTRDGQTAAIGRAESRARIEAERKAHAQDVVRRAPRDGDGLTVCDAGCMRERWGQAAVGVGKP